MLSFTLGAVHLGHPEQLLCFLDRLGKAYGVTYGTFLLFLWVSQQTLGVVPLEKKIILRNTEVTFSVWDLGGQREFLSMLPLVCNEAAAIFFMFDLSNKASLRSVKEWYRQARGLNRSAAAFLVGTKFDQFILLPKEKQAEIDRQARKYAKAMKASIVFTSSTHSVNVQNLFKVVLAKVFDLRSTLTKIDTVGDPLLMFN